MKCRIKRQSIISFLASAVFFVIVMPTVSIAGSGRDLLVPIDVIEVGTFRISESFFRYVVHDAERDGPCLGVQTFDHTQSPTEVLSKKRICSVTPEGESKVSLDDNMQFVDFRDIRANDTTFYFRVEYFPAEVSAPIFYTNCNVKVEKTGALGEVKCGPRKQLDIDAE